MLGGALAGLAIRAVLPEQHLTKQTEDAVKLGTGMVATLAALVIGLLIATAKSSFDTNDGEVRQFSANIILLDRQLVHYGPDAGTAHDLLRRYAVFALGNTWPDEGLRPAEADGWKLLEDVQDTLRALEPSDDDHRWLKGRALQISGDLEQTRWLLDVEKGSSIEGPFLVILVFWLTVIFTSFGLFAPRNATVITMLVVCAFSIAGAIFLILEMDHPFDGPIRISSAPMHEAVARLSR